MGKASLNWEPIASTAYETFRTAASSDMQLGMWNELNPQVQQAFTQGIQTACEASSQLLNGDVNTGLNTGPNTSRSPLEKQTEQAIGTRAGGP